MIFRIVTGDSRGVRGVYELEADTYTIDQDGVLVVSVNPPDGQMLHSTVHAIVCHAPGTWRSIVNAELFEKAVKRSVGTLDENSRGRLPARPIQAV
jgi:hypothetical protein